MRIQAIAPTILALSLVGCNTASSPETPIIRAEPTLIPTRAPTDTPIPSPSPYPTEIITINTPTVLPTQARIEPVETISVVTFNILLGAGVQDVDEYIPVARWKGNRLPILVDALERRMPDILGIQEASGWGSGSPRVIQKIAAQLGVNYYFADTVSGDCCPVALLTKFAIQDAQNLTKDLVVDQDPSHLGYGRALKTTLLTFQGRQLVLCVAHLNAYRAEVRKQQLAILAERCKQDGSPALIIGDLNYEYGPCAKGTEWLDCSDANVLPDNGWHHVTDYFYDQIWSTQPIYPPITSVLLPLARDMSDHKPVGAVIEIYQP